MAGTTKVTCTCQHAFQDAEHGKFVRVANLSSCGSKASCTVCGKVSMTGSYAKVKSSGKK